MDQQKNNFINIIEGVFDGENMIDREARIWPVPSNYASKSRLIEGDSLKLYIQEDGSYVFKQMTPVPRKSLIAVMGEDDTAITDNRLYKILRASVTYFKVQPGDRVCIIIAANGEPAWAALKNKISDGSDKELEN